MCAAVGVMPVTVMLALTERASLIVMVPVPEGVVVTGGTSLAPERSTFWPAIIGFIDAQPARIPTAPASAIDVAQRFVYTIMVIPGLRWKFLTLPRSRMVRGG